MNKLFAYGCIGLVAFAGAGCATQSAYEVSHAHYCAGAYTQAAEDIKQESTPDGSSSHVLDNLFMGSAYFAGKGYQQSIEAFSAAENGLKEQDNASSILKAVGDDYLATTYDETMMNMYQALSYLAQNNIDRARVEFNRVDGRQGRAAERNSAMIRERQKELEETKNDAKNKKAEEVTKDAKCEGIADMEAELAKWNAYADYMNPAAVFMCGAFRLIWGEDAADAEKGIAYFKRAYGMHPSTVTQNATQILERRVNGISTQADKDFVVILLEDGMGPLKIEERKELIIPYRYPIHAGIALPKLVQRQAVHPTMTVYDGDNCIGKTETICELDRVVAAEFREEFKYAVASQIAGACIRVGVQIVALEALRISLDDQVKNGKLSPFVRDLSLAAAGAALSAASAALTHADTRIWMTLPKNYQAVIVPRPASGVLSLRDQTGSRPIVEVQIPAGKGSSFVYVKTPTATSAATAFSVQGN